MTTGPICPKGGRRTDSGFQPIDRNAWRRFAPAARAWLRFTVRLWRWARRMDRLAQLRHERNQLHELSDELLRDIGLTRHEANRESRRHYWDDIGWRR